MGLSSEERMLKMFGAFCGMRRSLLRLRKTTVRDGGRSHVGTTIVDDWVRQVDMLVGLMIEKLNTNGLYWLMGSNETSVISLYSMHYDLGRQNMLIDHDGQFERGTLGHYYFRGERSLSDLARCWTSESHGFSDNDQIRTLAAFWDTFAYVDALLYPLNRYDDGLFSQAVHDGLLRLSGEMLNRRFSLNSWYNEDHEDVSALVDLEKALLCRFKLFNAELDTVFAGQPDMKQPFDPKPLIRKVGRMTLSKVKQALDEADSTKWERQHKQEPKKEPLVGILTDVPEEEELQKIIDESMDRAAVEDAVQDMSTYYSTIMSSDWKDRFEKKTKKAKKKGKAS